MANEFEDMFSVLEEQLTPETYGETVVRNIETKFTGVATNKDSAENISREEERKTIVEALRKIKNKLRMCKNTRNHKNVKVNAQMHETREKLRAQIEKYEIRLQQIKDEEIGTNVDAVSMINAAKEAEMDDILNGKIGFNKPVLGFSEL